MNHTWPIGGLICRIHHILYLSYNNIRFTLTSYIFMQRRQKEGPEMLAYVNNLWLLLFL